MPTSTPNSHVVHVNAQETMQRVSETVRQALSVLGPVKPLHAEQVTRNRSQNRRVSDASLHELAHAAAATNGVVAGIPFAPQYVSNTLASVDAGRALAHELRMLAERFDAELLAQRAELCRTAQAVIDALAAQAKLRGEAEPVVAHVRALNGRRRAKRAPLAPVAPKPQGLARSLRRGDRR